MVKKHILVVDDAQMHRELLTTILTSAGYRTSEAQSGDEAMRKIIASESGGNSFDLVVTDIMMPGMSGLELLDELKKNKKSLPVLAVTAHGNKNLVIDLMRKGCSDYIEKPVCHRELLESIRRIFEQTDFEKARRDKMGLELDNLKSEIHSAVKTYQDIIRTRERGHSVRVACFNQPISTLGGDFAGLRDTPFGCDALVADVSGHDLSASYHTVLIDAVFRENLRLDEGGRAFFRLLNNRLYSCGESMRTATAVFLRLNLEIMCGEAVSAGHPPLIIHAPSKPASSPPDLKGYPLGISKDVRFQGCVFPISSGDRFFLYTDGITDSYRLNVDTGEKERLTQTGLKKLIEKHGRMPIKDAVGEIGKAIAGYGGYKIRDDVMLLGLEIP